MSHENFMSKTEDVVWLAYKLKDELGDKISINKIGLYKEVLEGVYNLNGRNFYEGGSIYFGILYSNKEFLRIYVGEIGTSLSSYEDKVFVLNELKNAISNIVRNGVSLGEPSVFYNVRDDEYKVPHLEYIYADKENYIRAFQEKTIFDDGIPEDVIIFDTVKEREEFQFVTGKSYMVSDKYFSIKIIAKLKNKSDIDTDELRNIINENIEALFGDKYDNLFINYVCYGCDMAYVVSSIKRSLSIAEEIKLCITMIGNGNERCSVNYVNGKLIKYENCCKLHDYDFDTYYDVETGINFNTNCTALSAEELIEKRLRTELENINDLIDINSKYNIKSNNNLLKLVRRKCN